MVQKKQLEENIAFKNKLFSIVSHDVRTPLNSLHGLAALLAGKEDLSIEMLKPVLIDLDERIQVTSVFLENLLSWAKSQLEGYTPELTDLDLKTEATLVIDLFGQTAADKKITVINGIAADCIARADKNLLRLVLRNLLSNAIKFTHSGGRVEITAQPAGDNTLSVLLKDSGIGMTQANINKVLNGSGYTSLGTSSEKGTGLGLSLCKDFIAQMGGRLTVESTLGMGSTFSFSVPARAKVMAV
jgi:signal transduction histidine kinase